MSGWEGVGDTPSLSIRPRNALNSYSDLFNLNGDARNNVHSAWTALSAGAITRNGPLHQPEPGTHALARWRVASGTWSYVDLHKLLRVHERTGGPLGDEAILG